MTYRGGLHPMCELSHAVGRKVVTPGQFVGVEKDLAAHAANLKACRVRGATLIGDDIVSALHDALDEDPDFNPGLVNVDTHFEPDKAKKLCLGVLEALAHTSGTCFLSWNVITKNDQRGATHDAKTVASLIKSLSRYKKWKHVGLYHYPGTWPSWCRMTTFYFLREKA